MTGARRSGALLALALAAAFAIEAASYWPGVMTWDAAREYGMARGGAIDDWHPPVMIVLWRALLPIARGPGPMLAVQLALLFGGFALLVRWAWHQGRRGLAWALAAAALFPIPLAIEGAVLKDCLMAGAVLCALGLVADGRGGARLLARLLLLFAATLRFNAFLACLPLLVAAFGQKERDTRRRLVVTTFASAFLLVTITPLANRAIGATRSGVELSQIVFDLGGVTYYSGVDAFPPLPIHDPVAVNAHCYSPELWDPYSWWVDAPCPIGFVAVREAFARERVSPYGWWINQIARHPLAYAEHRLAHFNRNARLWVASRPPQLVPPHPDPNPYGFAPPHNAVRAAIDRAAELLARTPLDWPIWWIAVAGGVLLLGRTVSPLARLSAASALLYGAGYLVFSVASDLRYHLWTIIAALVAALVAGEDLRRARPRRARVILAIAPVVAVTLIGFVARLTLG